MDHFKFIGYQIIHWRFLLKMLNFNSVISIYIWIILWILLSNSQIHHIKWIIIDNVNSFNKVMGIQWNTWLRLIQDQILRIFLTFRILSQMFPQLRLFQIMETLVIKGVQSRLICRTIHIYLKMVEFCKLKFLNGMISRIKEIIQYLHNKQRAVAHKLI